MMSEREARTKSLTLVRLLAEAGKSEHRIGLMQDLAWKMRTLPEIERIHLFRQAIAQCQPGEVDAVMRLMIGQPKETGVAEAIADSTDIGIITARDFELKAVLSVFQVKKRSAVVTDRGRKYWLSNLQLGATKIRCAIACVGAPRNVPAALATADLIRTVGPSLCLFVGIAAGIKKARGRSGVRLGDVVLPRQILDYEHIRLQAPDKKEPLPSSFFGGLQRPAQFPCHKDVVGILESVSIAPDQWKTALRKHSRQVGVRLRAIKDWSPELSDGVMLSGEKLIANGKLNDVRLHLHDQIRGADQEDSGFAQACESESRRIYWAVVRGISDYGDGAKRKADRTQPAAAVSAALIAKEICLEFGEREITAKKNGGHR